jgi:hypothetical protein
MTKQICGIAFVVYERASPRDTADLLEIAQKMSHFWNGNWPVPLIHTWMASGLTGNKNSGFFAADPGLES